MTGADDNDNDSGAGGSKSGTETETGNVGNDSSGGGNDNSGTGSAAGGAEGAKHPLSLEEAQALFWRIVQRQDGDPATVDLTITLPITVARTLGLVAAVEERAIEAVVVEAVMQFTGFDAVLAMAADKPVPEEQQAESPRP